MQGVKIPRGTPIIIPVYSIHRDPTTWPDPERFDPHYDFSAEGRQSRDPFHLHTFLARDPTGVLVNGLPSWRSNGLLCA